MGAAQLQRLIDHGLKVTIAVDKVAASGGYMMACVGNNILSAPFAFIGSIGVVAQLPNVNKWLKNHDIDIEHFTAGEYKRTLTVLGENTEEGRRIFKQDLESIHH
ncbi:Periplasmic serine protease, ClpP family protein [Idiomarina baltica OS145]|uniref:Periplasmic serine protease, ClpP family protein n=1 Tax=Idiomarina baltica OS145 TaxID=314276 RepID=A0ABM9WIQ4_9GAMM|nr:Periplasmic serine protease, ClpP family protein [Idiomarina baltica OS145]